MLTEAEIKAEVNDRWPLNPVRNISSRMVQVATSFEKIDGEEVIDFNLSDDQVRAVAIELDKIDAFKTMDGFDEFFQLARAKSLPLLETLDLTADTIVTRHFQSNPNQDPHVEAGVRAGLDMAITAFSKRNASPLFEVKLGETSDGKDVKPICPVPGPARRILGFMQKAAASVNGV